MLPAPPAPRALRWLGCALPSPSRSSWQRWPCSLLRHAKARHEPLCRTEQQCPMWATTTRLLPSPGGTAGRAKTEGAGATLPAYAEPDSFVCFFFPRWFKPSGSPPGRLNQALRKQPQSWPGFRSAQAAPAAGCSCARPPRTHLRAQHRSGGLWASWEGATGWWLGSRGATRGQEPTLRSAGLYFWRQDLGQPKASLRAST